LPEHQTPLIAIIAGGLVLAFLFGLLAHRVRVSPLVGYLLAGVVVGPFTPGFVAEQELANQLAEIGVILLMFAVGLHFSLKDLMEVRAIAVPGALLRIVIGTLLGMGLAWGFGWPIGGGVVFGLALSVASTVVLVRSLQERRILDTERGRIAVGWLIVEDIATVFALVLLPTLAPGHAAALSAWSIVGAVALRFGEIVAFVALMLIAGRRIIPWIMHYTAHTGSRELFRLAVYAIALGVAFAAARLFDVSFALGAFLAGMVMGESQLSQRATEEALPLRDAFAVLFFVSVGMLFNPHILIQAPLAVLAVLGIIVFGKSLVAFVIVRAFGHPTGTALSISASLAQIGEFSFILAGLGVTNGMLPAEGRDLILAGAIISILINPLLVAATERRRAHVAVRHADHSVAASSDGPTAPPAAVAEPEPEEEAGGPPPVTHLTGHEVVVGYGRVGGLVGAALIRAGRPVLVFEEREEAIETACHDGAEVVVGNAADPEVLAAANLALARRLFVTIPEAFEAGQVVEQARAANPALDIVARAHSDAAVEHLTKLGATLTVMGEREIADRMIESAVDTERAA
jgi:CPA2 family monovalent cation:H+ antiporter-2